MADDLVYMSATEMVGRFGDGSLSPLEVTRAILQRIQTLDEKVNAYILVDADAAISAAQASERRWHMGKALGPVDGVPTSVKDLLVTRGWPTLRGSKATDPDQPWNEDAPTVARLKEQGAVLLGKTNTPEFGHKGVTDSLLAGITRNPWDLDKTPGGSSGGASAALAAGMGPLALGTDGGGSIRIPGSFAGVTGLKPTFGRVPAYPASPFGTLATVGPMARTVTDAALMYNVITRPDIRDWMALPDDGRDYLQGLEDGVKGLRIAYSRDLGLDWVKVDPEVAALVEEAAKTIAGLGATVEEADPTFPHDPKDVFLAHWLTGAAYLLSLYTEEQRAKMDPSLRQFAEEGRKFSMIDFYDAVSRRSQIGLALNYFFEKYDLLITPTMPIPAFKAGENLPSPDYKGDGFAWTPFTYPFNLSRQPASTIPCGFTKAGLPVGLQIVGRLHEDALVLQATRAYERANPLYDRRPSLD
ncbi:MAG: amidase [Rhodospirillaceae bacterium]|nr:amidase [Rhodospirillaceae bacterium]